MIVKNKIEIPLSLSFRNTTGASGVEITSETLGFECLIARAFWGEWNGSFFDICENKNLKAKHMLFAVVNGGAPKFAYIKEFQNNNTKYYIINISDFIKKSIKKYKGVA